MNSLDKAIEMVLRWTAERKKERDAVIEMLEELVEACEKGKAVWQGYLDAPGSPGDQWTLVTWMGPARVRQLHEIDLAAKTLVKAICASAGPEVGRFAQFDEDVIELAYRQLRPAETGPDAAKAAIETMNRRIEHLRGLIDRIRTSRPAAKTRRAAGSAGRGRKAKKARKATTRRVPGKKSPKKAPKKKAAKKKAKRKPAKPK